MVKIRALKVGNKFPYSRHLSVSYTHLDVYKRQGIDGSMLETDFQMWFYKQWFEKVIEMNQNQIKAVSYTHLDVYKRQVQVTAERS